SASWPRWVRCPWHARPTVAHLPWFRHPELELVASRAEGPYLINRQSPNPIAFGCQFRHPGLVARTFHFGNRLPHTCRSGIPANRTTDRTPEHLGDATRAERRFRARPAGRRVSPNARTYRHGASPRGVVRGATTTCEPDASWWLTS